MGGAGGCTSSLSVLTPTVLIMWRDSWSMKTTSRREGMVVEVSRAVVGLSAWCGEKGASLCHIVDLPRWEVMACARLPIVRKDVQSSTTLNLNLTNSKI
jgi:hypothetical protein